MTLNSPKVPSMWFLKILLYDHSVETYWMVLSYDTVWPKKAGKKKNLWLFDYSDILESEWVK